MKVLFIDNYDSFVYNIVHYVGELGAEVEVFRNDAISLDLIEAKAPDAIILSPGPATPNEAGICLELTRTFQGRIPILGICLGHQTIAQVGGSPIIRAPELFHGKVSKIFHQGGGVFRNLPSPFRATRYHSLIIDETKLDSDFIIDARTEDGIVMGLSHKSKALFGVQFHPESYATEHGHQLLNNFLDLAKAYGKDPEPVAF